MSNAIRTAVVAALALAGRFASPLYSAAPEHFVEASAQCVLYSTTAESSIFLHEAYDLDDGFSELRILCRDRSFHSQRVRPTLH